MIFGVRVMSAPTLYVAFGAEKPRPCEYKERGLKIEAFRKLDCDAIGSGFGNESPLSRAYWYSHEPKTRILCVTVKSRRAVVKYCWRSRVKSWFARDWFGHPPMLLQMAGPKSTVLRLELYCGAKPRKNHKRSFMIGPPTVKPG